MSLSQITTIKLTELKKQHQTLLQKYEQLEQEVAQETDLYKQLELLYNTLHQLEFAQRKIHPNIKNYQGILMDALHGLSSKKFLQHQIDILKQEVFFGKKRLETSLLFGEITQSCTFDSPSPSNIAPSNFQQELKTLWTKSPNVNVSAFKEWIHDIKKLDEIKEGLKELDDVLSKPPSNQEVTGHLNAFQQSLYQYEAVKKEGKNLSHLMITELASTMTILLNNIENWAWAKEGYKPRAEWTKNKWRYYHDADLINTLLVEIVGIRLGVELKKNLVNKVYADGKRLDNERLSRRKELLFPFVPDQADKYKLKQEYGGSYGVGVDAFQLLFKSVNSEIEFVKQLQKENILASKNIYVTGIDFKQFFYTIPHQLVITFLEEIGIPSKWIRFVERYLAIPYKEEKGSYICQSGLSLSFMLSSVLADAFLMVLDAKLYDLGVQFYRFMDDAFIITDSPHLFEKALAIVHDFSQMTGIVPNKEKSGIVAIGKRPKKIRNNLGLKHLPKWSFLQLNKDGSWEMDKKMVQQYAENLKQYLNTQSNIFEFTATYNQHIRFFMRTIGIHIPLDERHFENVTKALFYIHETIFGKQSEMDKTISKIIGADKESIHQLLQKCPDALYYLPITAGGFGILNPSCLLAGKENSYKEAEYPNFPEFKALKKKAKNMQELSKEKNDIPTLTHFYLLSFFRSLLGRSVEEEAPKDTVVMKSLMNDFIDRGSEVTGRDQKGLSIYWKWVLYTYGSQILADFGTFRFIETELVPLQVVLHRTLGKEEA